MPIYKCEKCDQEFKQKSDYTRHVNKKYPCITQTELSSKLEKVKENIKTKIGNIKENNDSDNFENDLERDLAELSKPVTKLIVKAETTNSTDNENVISNKEALKDKIHEIHNFLRNNGAGYGMNALKVFNILYGLKKIEENKLLDKIKLKKPDCAFSHLLDLANKNKDEELTALIYGSVLDSISTSEIRELLFYEIPRNIKSSNFTYLIKEINKITEIEKKCNVLLSGKVYEYFIGRDETAISELGAYFTDRHIVDYIYNDLKLELNEDFSVKTMCDMFGGSGGFTTGYINYLNKTYPDEIKWQTELNKVYHYDMNEDVIKSAGLEFFCLTGVMPNMKTNLLYKNSFADEFGNKKFDLIITNPPYGGDKNKQSDAQLKRDKVKAYIKEELKTLEDEDTISHRKKQLKAIEDAEKQEKKDGDKSKVSLPMCSQRINKFAVTHGKLSANDKEACSLILMMDMLNKNGTCVGVLKEGVFFNKTYKDLRKCLINNFNVKKVVSVPQDQFENTSTKTSIITFENTDKKTEQVEFYDLYVEKFEEDKFEEINNNIILTENKGDIKKVSDVLISTATLEELNENPINSLNGKDYNKKEIVCGKNYELKKLGDLCELKSGKAIKSTDRNGTLYPYYAANGISGYVDEYLFDGNYILCAQDGSIGATHLVNGKFYPSNHVWILEIKSVNIQYIYTFLKYIINYEKYVSGSVIPKLTKENLSKILIPVPKTQEKMKYWVELISKQHNILTTKQAKILELETQITNKIQDIAENEECDKINFDDMCVTVKGKQLSKDKFVDGLYPVIGGGISPTGYHNKYNMEKNTILCSSSGANAGFINKYNVEVWASDCFSITSKSKDITNNCLYYLLKKKQEEIFKCQTGSAQPHVYSSDLSKHISFLIPKNKKSIQKLEPTFVEIEKLQEEVKNAETLYNKYIKQLSEEAIPTVKQTIKTTKTDKFEEIDNSPDTSLSSVKKTVRSNKNIVVEETDEISRTSKSTSKKSI